MPQLKLNENGETGCCRKFDPEPWDEKQITWEGKRFVKDRVTSFLHIPLNMGGKVVKNMKLMEAAGASNPEQIMLTDELSPWASDIYIATDKDVPGAQMAELSGTFVTKVYQGPYRDISKWIKDMNEWVTGRGSTYSKLYFSYTTCPRCAHAYGKNYVVLFARIDRDDIQLS